MAEINQLLEQAVAGCDALSASVVQTGEQVEHARQTVEQTEERVHTLAGETEARATVILGTLDTADHKLHEHSDGVLAMVDQLHQHREAAAQKLGQLVATAHERIPALQQKKAELMETIHASSEHTRAGIAELTDHVNEFQAHAEQLHESAKQAVETFKTHVNDVREKVAHHREQLGQHVDAYKQSLNDHADALAQQVATLKENTVEPVNALSDALDAQTDQATSAIGDTFAQQVVSQLGGGIEQLLGAFGALRDATGGQETGVENALETIAGPVDDIGKILKDIQPVVDLIRRML